MFFVLVASFELIVVVGFELSLRSKRLGWVLKIVVMVTLPLPLIIWPIMAMIGSLLGGIGYGFFAPLIATFEAIGQNVKDKFYHCFVVSICSVYNLFSK